jgi:serine/threonine protein kinase
VKCGACQKDVPPGRFCLQCGAALSQALRFGDYEVDGVVGEGGMGRVYKARQPRLKRVVCIKTLLPQFATDEAVVTRFEREATTTAALKHPNIVSIIDVGRGDDGAPFIVMEYVEGRSLRQVMRDEAPLAPVRAIGLIDQVLAGLAEAHAHGIVHRDLKPSNVLVEALKDGTELCKVLDFGIARTIGGDTTDPQLTRTGMMLGTPGYMAPEQISSSDFDHRVDLYAAGVILYELLVGARMVRAPNETELLKKTLLEEPPAPSSRVSTNIPTALDAAVLKAVTKEPTQRFSSASEFREVLGRSLGSSVSVFTNPAMQVQLDTTPLAQAASDTASNDVANPRALLTAVLGTTEGWELSRMLEVFERSVQELLSSGQTAVIAVLLRTLQDEGKQRAGQEAFKAVVALLRASFLAHLTNVLSWLELPESAQVARWMMKVIGRDGTVPLLERLQQGTPEERAAVIDALRLVEPKVTELVERVRTLPVAVMKTMVQGVSRWPEADATAFVTAALNSSSAPHRHAVLEGLSEAQAFRATATLRVRLHDPHPAVRAEALRWVFRLEDDGAVPELMKALERPSITATERKQMYRTLGHLGGPAMTVLLRALMKEADDSALAELVSVLTRSKDASALAAVQRLADDPKTPKPLKQLCTEGLKSALAVRPGPRA